MRTIMYETCFLSTGEAAVVPGISFKRLSRVSRRELLHACMQDASKVKWTALASAALASARVASLQFSRLLRGKPLDRGLLKSLRALFSLPTRCHQRARGDLLYESGPLTGKDCVPLCEGDSAGKRTTIKSRARLDSSVRPQLPWVSDSRASPNLMACMERLQQLPSAS